MRFLLSCIFLHFLSVSVFSQNYNPKFEQGVDLAEFVDVALGDYQSQQSCMPIPQVGLNTAEGISHERIIPPALWRAAKAGPGYLGGPYDPRVINSVPYQNALMYPTLIGQHESQTAYYLLARWESLKTTRSELLSDAGSLNSMDSALYREGVEIDNAAAAFEREKAALQAEVARYNQQCAGQPATYYCTAWYNNLKAKIADYNRRVNTHNQKVEVWRGKVQNLKNSVSSWLPKVDEWEMVILDFIEDARSYLANPDAGTCPPCPAPPPSEIHHVPPETPHYPCKGDHEHYFEVHQGPPPECKCRTVRKTKCLDKSDEAMSPNDFGRNFSHTCPVPDTFAKISGPTAF